MDSLAVLATPIAASGDTLPSEFLLFAAGENPNYNSEKQGEAQPIFTPRSAEALQNQAARKGSDYFLDLEHSSMRTRAPGSTDAMAWFRLETRPDGSCWAVAVRWTPEGARRLRAASQRYVSPVFYFDRETGEVTEFVGCALTSDPATYDAAPLVAASRFQNVNARVTHSALTVLRAVAEARLTRGVMSMDPALGKKILDAIAADDPKAALELLREIATTLISGASDAAATDTPAEPTASTADPPQPDPNAPPAQQSRSADDDRIAVLERELAAVQARNADLDLDVRRELIAELVRVGAETPHTAWTRDAKGNVTTTPCARLASESLRGMRDRVAVLKKTAPLRSAPPVSASTDRDPAAFSPHVRTLVEKMTPEQRDKFDRYQQRLAANRKGAQ